VAAPMPEPESAAGGVYCEGCHEVKPRYGVPQMSVTKSVLTTALRQVVVERK